MAQYNTGTADFTTGVNIIDGNGTAWQTSGEVAVGNLIIGPNGIPYTIDSIVSDTRVTISTNYAGNTVNGAEYAIHIDYYQSLPLFDPEDAELSALLNEVVKYVGSKTQTGTEATAGIHKISTLAAALAGTDENTAMPPDLVHGAFNQYGLGIEGSDSAPQISDLTTDIAQGVYYVAGSAVTGGPSGINNVPYTLYVGKVTGGRQSFLLQQTSTFVAQDFFFGSRGAATGAITWQEIYHTGNILGTVSQSGGVPTGAVIERGSNANGEYVKFADGTLICHEENAASTTASTGIGALYRSSQIDWTFPAAFITSPTVGGTGVRGAIASGIIQHGGLSTTPTTHSFTALTQVSGDDVIIQLIAVGRWF